MALPATRTARRRPAALTRSFYLPHSRPRDDDRQREEQQSAGNQADSAFLMEGGDEVADPLERCDALGAHEDRVEDPADRAAGNQPRAEKRPRADFGFLRAARLALHPV